MKTQTGAISGGKTQFHPIEFRPDHISGLSCWLDASDLSTIDTTTAAPDVDSWTDKSSNGLVFSQSTAAKKPHSGVDTVNGRNVVSFDGVDDILVVAGIAGFDGTKGHLFTALETNTGSFGGYFLSSADEGTADFFWTMDVNSGNQLCRELIRSASGANLNRFEGDTTLSASTAYLLHYRSNDTAYAIDLNKSAETLAFGAGSDDGKWLNDVPNRDNVTIGAGKFNAEGGFCDHKIGEIIYYDNVDLTATQIETIENYLKAKWGI